MADSDYVPGPLAEVDLGFKVGEEFLTLRRFEGILEERSAKNYVKYYKRDSKTMESAKRHNKFYTESTLKFYSVKYGCIFSGKLKASQSTGKRCVKSVRQRTFCPAGILIKASKTNNFYQIVNIISQHNHYVSKELYEQPCRKISKVTRKTLKAEEATKSYDQLTCEVMTSICDEVQDKHNVGFQLYYVEEQFKCGFFFSEVMIATMSAFPENFSIQTITHELITTNCPLYVMTVENACGLMSVVGFFIILQDDTFNKSLKWMMQNFLKLNEDVSSKVKNVIITSDIQRKDVIMQHFPKARDLSLSYNFIIKYLNSFNSNESDLIKGYDLIKNLLKSKEENEFNRIINSMNLSDKISTVDLDLFKSEWKPEIGETVSNFIMGSINFIVGFDNRLHEGLLTKRTIDALLEKIINLIEYFHNDHLKTLSMNKSLRSNSSIGSELEYKEVLTLYAFNKVLNEILASSTNLTVDINDQSKGFLVDGYSVTETTCSCAYFNDVQLPCCHIFKVRQMKKNPMYEASLFNARWTINYSLNLFPNINFDEMSNLDVDSSDDSELPEKHNILKVKCKEIAKYGSKANDEDFNFIITFLEEIIKCYQQKAFCLKAKVTSRAAVSKKGNLILNQDSLKQPATKEIENNIKTENVIHPCSLETFSLIKFTLPSEMKKHRVRMEED